MRFQPATERRILEEEAIPFERRSQLSAAQQKGVCMHYGHAALLTGTQCALVGLFDVATELVSKARTFLIAAIEGNEIGPLYVHGASESSRLTDLAMCQWIIERRHDVEAMKNAVRWRETWFVKTGNRDKSNIQLTLPDYLDAQEYEVLLARFEAGGLKPPKNLRAIRGEGTMAYVVARHRLGLEYSPEEVEAALDTFFKRNVRATWLDLGHYTTAATWMRIAFWKPGDDQIATLLRCYDYMPDLERPDYPTSSLAGQS